MGEVNLKACPFCAAPLHIRHPHVNPTAECLTDGCWMNARRMTIALDDPAQVAAWNRRPAEREDGAARAMAFVHELGALALKPVAYDDGYDVLERFITKAASVLADGDFPAESDVSSPNEVSAGNPATDEPSPFERELLEALKELVSDVLDAIDEDDLNQVRGSTINSARALISKANSRGKGE